MQAFIKKLSSSLGVLLLGFFISIGQADPIDANTLTDKAEVKTFINEMVAHYQFDRAELTRVFSQVKILPEVLTKIKTPYETKPWYIYRNHFMTEQHLADGVKFWQAHNATLNSVAKQYGIPVNVLLGVIGVESHYGSHTGKYPVINALSTLAFAYPPRAKFFKSELVQYLLMTREQKIDPWQLYGSYAGAIGWPQFMPSSYRRFAVDYTGNGHADLSHNVDDVIASVANYLKKNGWQNEESIAVPVSVSGDGYQSLMSNKIKKPELKLSQFTAAGIKPQQTIAGDPKAMLFKLEVADNQTEYWLGFHDFYVITRYNPSILYAMAVYELGNTVQERVAGH